MDALTRAGALGLPAAYGCALELDRPDIAGPHTGVPELIRVGTCRGISLIDGRAALQQGVMCIARSLTIEERA
jgi:hypothetical protein